MVLLIEAEQDLSSAFVFNIYFVPSCVLLAPSLLNDNGFISEGALKMHHNAVE